MKRGKALCRILAVLLICALVAGFAPVAETISAPAQETAAGAETAETVTDVLPSGEDGDPDAAKDPDETPNPGETKDPGETPNPGETPDPGETPNPDETPAEPTIVSAKDTTEAVWAQSRTVTIQTAGPVDKVQYRVEDTEEWKSAAAGKKNGEYQFVLTESSNEVVTYQVRALNKKEESKTVEVKVGKIDATAPTVEVSHSEAWDYYKVKDYYVEISDKLSGNELSGLDLSSIQIQVFYYNRKGDKEYLNSNDYRLRDLNNKFNKAKKEYKGGVFDFLFTIHKYKDALNEHYEFDIEVSVNDNVGNKSSYIPKASSESYGSVDCKVTPELTANKAGELVYLVGDQSEVKLTGMEANQDIYIYVNNYSKDNKFVSKSKTDGDGVATINLGQELKAIGKKVPEKTVFSIVLQAGKSEATLPLYYVSGAPAVHSVDFYNSSAIKNFIHTITGGLMFAKSNELTIKPEESEATGEKTVGAAYYWKEEDAKQPENPMQLKNPTLVDNGQGGIELNKNDKSWKQAEDMIIPCPKDDNFSGYLHVVVWNEVGTCTQYVYKAETGKELKLTNYGVFNGADNGVAVFVTTPDGKEGKPYTAQRDVLDKNGDRTGTEDNWVKQVNFDVQWDESKLKTWLMDWAKKQPGYQGTETETEKISYDWSKFALAQNGVVVTATATAEDGKATEDKEVVSGQNSGQAKSFTIGGNVGSDGKNQISRNTPVRFTVTVSATVEKTTTPKNADGTTGKPLTGDVTVKESFTTEEIPVYVQNYLNVPTVTAEAQVTANRGTANEKKEPITGTDLKDGETYGWYNGYNNVLTSLKLTKCSKSNAPYTMEYTLTRPDKKPDEKEVTGSLSSAKLDENGLDAFKGFNEDGVYKLEVHATDAAGNESETAVYTIKYDVNAPDVHAVFSEKADKDPFYKQQRTIDIKVSDKLFDGNKNVTFDEELKKPDQNQKDGDYTLTGKMTNPDQRGVSIETTIQYTNGNPPVFDRDRDRTWTYTGAGKNPEGSPTLPSWSGTYKYGSVDGNIRDGDDYTLCITATDEAGNVTVTDANGKCTQNGQDIEKFCAYTFKGEEDGKTDFTIDQTTPEVSVRFDNNSVVNGKYFPAGRTATITVVEHNFYDKGVELTATGASGSTDWVHDGDTHTATVSFLNDADCKFAIEVTDKAGNICDNEAVNYGGSVAPGEFVIDTTAPTLALTGVNGPFADACTPGFEGQDANMSTEYELHLMRSVRENAADDATALCSRELVNISTTDIRAVFQNIPDMLDNAEYYSDGIYKLSVTIRDMADNTTTQEATFAVNRHGSFYIYGEALANLVTKQFAQNDFVDAQAGAWTIMEYNASPVQPDSVQLQIYRDNALVTSVTPEIKGGMDDATGLYRYVYELDRNMFAQDGLYKVQVRSTDEAGNLSENIDEVDDNGNVTTPEKYQCTLSFVIDNVDPEFKQITGLEKRRYREDSHEINFAVADTYGLARVSVLSGETVVAEYLCAAEIDALGGETKLAANQKPMPDELTLESVSGDVMLRGGKSTQTITFVAVDKAGNTYTTGSADQKPLSFHQKVTISTNGFVLYIHNTWAVVLTVVALAAVAFGVWYGVSKKKKREGAAS